MPTKIKELFQKKRLLLFSLFFIIFASSLPLRAAKAIEIPILSRAWETIKEAPLNLLLTAVYLVVYEIANLVLMIASYLVKLGAWLVDAMLEPAIYSQVLDIDNPSSAVMTGWTVIRDMGNIFFVLLLLIIAFSTILRIQQYNARTLLPKFIIVLFLMNFSAVFAGIVIDFGQVFMYEIRNWMGQFSTDAGSMGSLTSFIDGEFISQFGFVPPEGGFSLENAVGVSFAAIFVLLLGACYIMLAGFLLIRLIAFAILIILSPAAILGMVMPGLRSISSEWWQKIWQYSLFGPLFIFFVYLAGTMATSLKGYTPSVTPTGFGETGNTLSYLVTLVVPYAVSLGMLYAVIPITQRLGIAGASMLIGGTMGFGKIVMGSYMVAKGAAMGFKKVATPAVRRVPGYDTARDVWKRGKQRLAETKAARLTGISTILLKGEYGIAKEKIGKAEEQKNFYAMHSTNGRYGELKDFRGKSDTQLAGLLQAMIEKKELTQEKMSENNFDPEKISSVLARAGSAMDREKLKETMPHWAAMAELGPGASKNKIDEKTAEIVKNNVSEGKLGSLNRAAMENALVIDTIRNEHDDFDKWVGSRSNTDQKAINVGLENVLREWQKEIHTATGGAANINTVNAATLGGGPIGSTGMNGDKLKKEINKMQKTMAKNDENGHVFLRNPEINATGSIVVDAATGRINFNAPGSTENINRKKEAAESMKGESAFKFMSSEFYQEMGQYLSKAQLDTLRKAGSTEQMRAAKNSILAPGSTASPEVRVYVQPGGNTYYENL